MSYNKEEAQEYLFRGRSWEQVKELIESLDELFWNIDYIPIGSITLNPNNNLHGSLTVGPNITNRLLERYKAVKDLL